MEQPPEPEDRSLTTREAAKDLASSMFGEEEVGVSKTLPKARRMQMAAAMLMAGTAPTRVEEALCMKYGTLTRWFVGETKEMQRLMKQALSADAVKEMAASWQRLKKLRDSYNGETARKAALDLMRLGGVAIDAGGGGTVINAENVQINGIKSLGLNELDKAIREISETIGPSAEVMVRSFIGEPNGGDNPSVGADVIDGNGEGENEGGEAGTPPGPGGGESKQED